MPRTVKQEVIINAPVNDVYEAFLDSRKHSAFTGAKAKASKKAGGLFTAYDGYIEGVNIELVENKRIVQAWRGSNWKAGEWSIMNINLKKRGKTKTTLSYEHLAVPDNEVKAIKKGWTEHYWDKMNEYFKKK